MNLEQQEAAARYVRRLEEENAELRRPKTSADTPDIFDLVPMAVRDEVFKQLLETEFSELDHPLEQYTDTGWLIIGHKINERARLILKGMYPKYCGDPE